MDSNNSDIEELVSIRCPSKRPHGKYSLCGHLLLMTYKGRLFLHCESCKTIYELIIKENDNVEMIELPKNQRLILKNKLKVII